MSAEKEIDRLEREINAKAGGGGQGRSGPPTTTGGNSTSQRALKSLLDTKKPSQRLGF